MKKKKTGFTLIEIIIVLMLSVIIIGIMNAIFMSGIRVFSDANVKSDLQIEGQTTHETLSKIAMQVVGIKEVDNIDFYDPNDNGSKEDFMAKTEFTSINELVLSVAETKEESDKEIVFEKAYTFVLDDGRLLMSDSDSISEKVLSTNVESFNVKANNTGMELEINLKKKRPFADEKKYPINLEVQFRNKDAIIDEPLAS